MKMYLWVSGYAFCGATVDLFAGLFVRSFVCLAISVFMLYMGLIPHCPKCGAEKKTYTYGKSKTYCDC
jgi:hypothetical protein